MARKNARPDGPLLVVSAFAPELAPLRRCLRRLHGFDRARAVICQPVGIGLVESAAGAARALAACTPRAVLFVGTAGAYAPALSIDAIVIARDLVLVSAAVARGEGFLPAPMTVRLTASAVLSGQLLKIATAAATAATRKAPAATRVAHANVASPLAITRTVALARRLVRDSGAQAENLEVFAVASAARALRIPFAAVLGIANRVGPAAHREWLAHQASATRAACSVVAAYLTGAVADDPAGAAEER